MPGEWNAKRKADLLEEIARLSDLQLEVLGSFVDKFNEEQSGEHLRDDFIDSLVFEYFSVRLAAHHASSSVALKKENFEHILERSFRLSGHQAKLTDSMVHPGADIQIDGRFYSLKTEAAKGLNPKSITISKLMEARWIRDIRGPEDIPPQIDARVKAHLANYERIFILRSYGDNARIRYDLREIPKDLLEMAAMLEPENFRPISKAGGTSADVMMNGRKAFCLRLDGSVEKLTISGLKVDLCPLHAWWELGRPG